MSPIEFVNRSTHAAQAEALPKHHASATAVRVSGLFYPELLVEIQAIVAVAS